MTSRTIDIKCEHCRKYLFSLMPNDKRFMKDFYCRSKICKEAATAAKLKGKDVELE